MVSIQSFWSFDDGPDYYNAFCRALASYSNVITFEAKEYFFSKPLEVFKTVHLLGEGTGSWITNSKGNGTVFRFPANCPGIILHSTKSLNNPKYVDLTKLGGFASEYAGTVDSAETIIENIVLKCEGDIEPTQQVELDYPNDIAISLLESTEQADTRSHGVTCFRRPFIRNVSVVNFNGHGIYIFGHPAVGEYESNCDMWRIDNTVLAGNAADGLHVFGGDTGLGTATSLHVILNKGWGIVDFSRSAGNVFINCHDGGTNLTGGFLRPYKLRLPRDPLFATTDYVLIATSQFIGCYHEGSNSYISAPNFVINSNIYYHGRPNVINAAGRNGVNFESGLRASGYRVVAATEPYAVVKLGAANREYSNLAVHLEYSDSNDQVMPDKTYHIYFEESLKSQPNEPRLKGWWEFKAYGQLSQDDGGSAYLTYPLRLSTAAANVGAAQVWMENGVHLGRLDSFVRLNSASVKPATTVGYPVGSVVFNAGPEVGSYAGWILCKDGSWQPFGRIG